MKILVIEDEKKTAKFLKKGLGETGYVVDVAGDGLEGLHLALEVDFDLIVLDVMLPALDGWQVLTRLRRAGGKTLVLMLTARVARWRSTSISRSARRMVSCVRGVDRRSSERTRARSSENEKGLTR
jgi:CheY-like chemotaxis protein